jgi:LysR family transcriptional regulator (chromosome initiation inhibitor)
MLRLARQVSLLEIEAIAAVKGRVEGLRVPVAVNADSLNGWFLPALLAVSPELVTAFDLRQEDQDHSADLLRDGTVLAAVTADPRPVQGCRVRVLGRMRYLPIATPEFAERWLTGRPLVDALGEAPMVIFNPKDMLQHRLIRQLTRRRLEPPAHSIPAPGAFSRSIRLGLGWGMLEEEAVVDDLAAGRLVEVAKGKYVEVPLYWQHWKLESAVLDALTTAVLDAAETGLRTP